MDPKILFDQYKRLPYLVYKEKFSRIYPAVPMKQDLIQMGMLALWKCCRSYDESRGIKFSTYAYRAIYNSMISCFRKEVRHGENCVSLWSEVETEKEKGLCYEDILFRTPDLQSEICMKCLIDFTCKQFKDERYTTIVKLICEGFTQQEIGDQLGCTKTRISQMLTEFKSKLKSNMKRGI